MKWCSKCGERLPVESFYPDKRIKGGRASRCSSCRRTGESIRYASKEGQDYSEKYYRYNFSLKYKRAVRHALKRGIKFLISEKEFIDIVNGSYCKYCSGQLPLQGHGLDRIDNKGPYSKDNVVPCCGVCNYVRGNTFSFNEMVKFIGPTVKLIRKEREESGGRLASIDASPSHFGKKA